MKKSSSLANTHSSASTHAFVRFTSFPSAAGHPQPGPIAAPGISLLAAHCGHPHAGRAHNREPNAEPTKWTDYVFRTTGKYPALWSGDFLFQQENIDHRWTMIKEAERQWRRGAVVNLMWHACPPGPGEPCGWDPGLMNAPLTDAQWQELITDGTALNKAWKARMDDIAVYLQYLKDRHVEVLFRPLHEMNQGKFWWGGRPGPQGTARLYQITHDYLKNTKGLTNLV